MTKADFCHENDNRKCERSSEVSLIEEHIHSRSALDKAGRPSKRWASKAGAESPLSRVYRL